MRLAENPAGDTRGLGALRARFATRSACPSVGFSAGRAASLQSLACRGCLLRASERTKLVPTQGFAGVSGQKPE